MIYVIGHMVNGKVKEWYCGRNSDGCAELSGDLSNAVMLHLGSVAAEILDNLNEEEGSGFVIQSFQNAEQLKFVLDIYNESKVKDLEISSLKMTIEALKGEKSELIKRIKNS